MSESTNLFANCMIEKSCFNNSFTRFISSQNSSEFYKHYPSSIAKENYSFKEIIVYLNNSRKFNNRKVLKRVLEGLNSILSISIQILRDNSNKHIIQEQPQPKVIDIDHNYRNTTSNYYFSLLNDQELSKRKEIPPGEIPSKCVKTHDYYDYIVSKEKNIRDKVISLNLKYRKAILTLENLIKNQEKENTLKDITVMINRLNYKTTRDLTLCVNTYYDIKELDQFKHIMEIVYRKTHASFTHKSFNRWIEIYPNEVYKKINGIKRRNKKVDPKRSKIATRVYNNSEKKITHCLSGLAKLGYNNIGASEIISRKEMKNEDLIIDIINNINENGAEDNDLLEIIDIKLTKTEIDHYQEKCDFEYLEYLRDHKNQLSEEERKDLIELTEKYEEK